MKRLIVLCLAGFIVGAAGAQQSVPQAAPLTREQQEQLKERDRLWQEARKLEAEGKLAEALAAAHKKLVIEREVFGTAHKEVAETLQFLCEMHERRGEFPVAHKGRQAVLAIQTKL